MDRHVHFSKAKITIVKNKKLPGDVKSLSFILPRNPSSVAAIPYAPLTPLPVTCVPNSAGRKKGHRKFTIARMTD